MAEKIRNLENHILLEPKLTSYKQFHIFSSQNNYFSSHLCTIIALSMHNALCWFQRLSLASALASFREMILVFITFITQNFLDFFIYIYFCGVSESSSAICLYFCLFWKNFSTFIEINLMTNKIHSADQQSGYTLTCYLQ